MAKVKLAAVINALSGRVGGIAFLPGPAGPMSVIAAQPRIGTSATQKASLTAWSDMIKAWNKSTTTADRKSWSSFANANPITDNCGNSRSLSGFSAFARSNRRLRTFGHAPLTSAPGTFTATSPGSISLLYTPGPPASLTVTPANPPGPTEAVAIKGTGPLYLGRKTTNKKTVILGTEPAGSAGPWQILSRWEAKFGKPRSGSLIAIVVDYCDLTSGAVGGSAAASLVIP